MPQEVIHVNVRKLPVRILLILLLLVAGLWSYFVVRWYIGNTLAEYFDPSQSNIEVANMAVSMAPDDPLTHWRVAQVTQKTLPLDQQNRAIAEFEKAVSLSPQDYRFWVALGVAHEQSGDPQKAEKALRRAVALAPAYSYPHWYLGNLLIRNARYEEAFAELRTAGDADPALRPQLFNLVWEIYSNDPEALKNAVGQSSTARADFALYLINQKRVDDGLRLWNSLSADEKRANKATGESIVTNLKNELRFHDAANVWNDVMTEKLHMTAGQVFDGSFEEVIAYSSDSVFGWQVRGALQMSLGIDPNKSHNGKRSLKMFFQVRGNLEGLNVSQLVPVAQNTEYDFECYVATKDLQTGSAPEVQILDATTGAALGQSPQAPGGSNDWTRHALSFKTGDKTEAIWLKIVRSSCMTEDTPVCPIFGSVWYDDFTLKRRN